MAMFKAVAIEQLKLLFLLFVAGSTFRAVPAANPPNACGIDLYLRVVLAHYFLVLAVLAAAMLHFQVRMSVNAAEAAAVAAARAAAAAADGDKTFDADHEAAVAAVKGLGSVAAKWNRVYLRATLLLAVVLSAAASYLAAVSLQDGFRYRIGCDPDYAWYGAGKAMGAILLCFMVVLHGISAWVAVSQN